MEQARTDCDGKDAKTQGTPIRQTDNDYIAELDRYRINSPMGSFYGFVQAISFGHGFFVTNHPGRPELFLARSFATVEAAAHAAGCLWCATKAGSTSEDRVEPEARDGLCPNVGAMRQLKPVLRRDSLMVYAGFPNLWLGEVAEDKDGGGAYVVRSNAGYKDPKFEGRRFTTVEAAAHALGCTYCKSRQWPAYATG